MQDRVSQRARHACAVFALAGAMCMTGCGDGQSAGEGETQAATLEEIAVIEVAGKGTIRLRLFDGLAPAHVDNFKKLARSGFYDGTTFHRVIPGFMIQGGDPLSKDGNPTNDGTGGPGYTIDAEFSDRPHRRGTLSMARAKDPNSAGSQFFIMVADSPAWSKVLDGRYTIFGEVIDGMEVADAVAGSARDRTDRPLENVVMSRVAIESIPVSELPADPNAPASESANAAP